MNFMRLHLALSVAGLVTGCATVSGPLGNISKQPFGLTTEGVPVDLYVLRNDRGAEVRIITHGARVVGLSVPDRDGRLGDVVLGSDTLDGYLADKGSFGATMGRYANRIGGAKFTLDGKEYKLAANNGPNHIHGGPMGFHKAVWSAKPIETTAGPALELRYLSKDGEEGYPGNLAVVARYTLTRDNALRIELSAITDRATVLNLTHHSYFNLAGAGVGDVLNHEVMINADRFTPTDAGQIPTGELRPVRETAFDFTKPMKIGARIDGEDEQLKFGAGYDHNWVLNKRPGELALAARVSEPTSGRVMEVWTTQPGVQFYTGNHLGRGTPGKGGKEYARRSGFCLEPEHYPDSPNKPQFPAVVLRLGEQYRQTIIYKFSVQ